MASKAKYSEGDKVLVKKRYDLEAKDRNGTIMKVERGPRGLEYLVQWKYRHGNRYEYEELWFTAIALIPRDT